MMDKYTSLVLFHRWEWPKSMSEGHGQTFVMTMCNHSTLTQYVGSLAIQTPITKAHQARKLITEIM